MLSAKVVVKIEQSRDHMCSIRPSRCSRFAPAVPPRPRILSYADKARLAISSSKREICTGVCGSRQMVTNDGIVGAPMDVYGAMFIAVSVLDKINTLFDGSLLTRIFI